jgi:hypothetical protein
MLNASHNTHQYYSLVHESMRANEIAVNVGTAGYMSGQGTDVPSKSDVQMSLCNLADMFGVQLVGLIGNLMQAAPPAKCLLPACCIMA